MQYTMQIPGYIHQLHQFALIAIAVRALSTLKTHPDFHQVDGFSHPVMPKHGWLVHFLGPSRPSLRGSKTTAP